MTDRALTPGQLMEQLTDEQRRKLEDNHFDADAFVELRRQFLAGELSQEGNQIDAEVTAPTADDVRSLPERDSEEGQRLIAIGRKAIDRGEVGALVLNGGMATRFGGGVKGCVTVFDDLSFLGIKLRDAARHNCAPVLLMNSFATHAGTMEHLDEHDYYGSDPDDVITFKQNISIRMTPDGELYRDDDGEISLYAPGHGDLPSAIRRGALQEFKSRGGKYLTMSNVDNILANLDPLVVGLHIDRAENEGVEMTVEAVERQEGHVGGMIARVDGDPQVVEHFRIPDDVDLDQLTLLNTNTFVFTADALDQDFDLTWFVVDKNVDGDTVIQFERLAGELSAFLQTRFIEVPHTGDRSRFLPIKRREDLAENREYLQRVATERGIV